MESSRQSSRAQAPRTFFSGQITYGSAPILRKLLDHPGQPRLNPARPDILSSLVQFASTRIAQSHVQMVQTLRMLESNLDNEGNDKPNTIKPAIRRLDWTKWREAM